MNFEEAKILMMMSDVARRGWGGRGWWWSTCACCRGWRQGQGGSRPRQPQVWPCTNWWRSPAPTARWCRADHWWCNMFCWIATDHSLSSILANVYQATTMLTATQCVDFRRAWNKIHNVILFVHPSCFYWTENNQTQSFSTFLEALKTLAVFRKFVKRRKSIQRWIIRNIRTCYNKYWGICYKTIFSKDSKCSFIIPRSHIILEIGPVPRK